MTSPAEIIFRFLEKRADKKPTLGLTPVEQVALWNPQFDLPIFQKGWRPKIEYPFTPLGQKPKSKLPATEKPQKSKSKKPSVQQETSPPTWGQKATQTFLNIAPQGPAQIAAAASTLPLLGALWYSIRRRRAAALKPAVKATESLMKIHPSLAIGGGVLGGLVLSKLPER